MSKVTAKLLVYEIKVPETDSEETINVISTNVVAERCFSITKHWEHRFCQVGIMQTCEIAKANINKCSEFIQGLSCQEIEQFHKRRLSKITRQVEKDEQAEYEKIVQSNRAKVVSELTQKDETVTAIALIIHEEPSFIPSYYDGKLVSVFIFKKFSELKTKFEEFKIHVQRSKAAKRANIKVGQVGSRRFKDALVEAIKMFVIGTEFFSAKKYAIPTKITEDFMNPILSDYQMYLRRQKE